MAVDFTGREINVGDVLVYAVGRASLDNGMVINIEDVVQTRRWNNTTYTETKVKLAKIHRGGTWVWDNAGRTTGHYEYSQNWTVKYVTIKSIRTSIVLDENQCMDDEELSVLIRFREQILAGNKTLGVLAQ